MVKYIFGILLVVLLPGCGCDEPVTIDLGKIPDSVLQMVPYQNGKTYKFRHSAGLVITFLAGRESREEWLRCHRCCDFVYKFEANTTALAPDYPIFSFSFDLSNPDSSFYSLGAAVGRYWFQIPTDDYQADYCDFADSVQVGGKFYRDVFKIKSNYGSAYDNDPIFADSIYYNYKNGIIRIAMSNGEEYAIYE